MPTCMTTKNGSWKSTGSWLKLFDNVTYGSVIFYDYELKEKKNKCNYGQTHMHACMNGLRKVLHSMPSQRSCRLVVGTPSQKLTLQTYIVHRLLSHQVTKWKLKPKFKKREREKRKRALLAWDSGNIRLVVQGKLGTDTESIGIYFFNVQQQRWSYWLVIGDTNFNTTRETRHSTRRCIHQKKKRRRCGITIFFFFYNICV